MIPTRYKEDLIRQVDRDIEAINLEFVVLGLRLNYNKTEILLIESILRTIKCDPEWMVEYLNIGGKDWSRNRQSNIWVS